MSREIKTITDLDKYIRDTLNDAMREVFMNNNFDIFRYCDEDDDFDNVFIEEKIIHPHLNYINVSDELNWHSINLTDMETVCDYVVKEEELQFGEYVLQLPYKFSDYINKYCYWWSMNNFRYLTWYKVLKNWHIHGRNSTDANAPIRNLCKTYVRKTNLKKVLKLSLPGDIIDEIILRC